MGREDCMGVVAFSFYACPLSILRAVVQDHLREGIGMCFLVSLLLELNDMKEVYPWVDLSSVCMLEILLSYIDPGCIFYFNFVSIKTVFPLRSYFLKIIIIIVFGDIS